jgi:hypothetical protein
LAKAFILWHYIHWLKPVAIDLSAIPFPFDLIQLSPDLAGGIMMVLAMYHGVLPIKTFG